jgi:hypothetical protein
MGRLVRVVLAVVRQTGDCGILRQKGTPPFFSRSEIFRAKPAYIEKSREKVSVFLLIVVQPGAIVL